MSNTLLDLVFFPFHDWKKCEIEGFRTRDAHFLIEFGNHPKINKVLVINRPISILEILLKRRYWRTRKGIVIFRAPLQWITQVSPKIYVLDIVCLDVIRPALLRFGWWGYIFQKSSIVRKIKSAIEILNLKKYILFISSPLSTGVVGHLNEYFTVFDALDNWLLHPEVTTGKGYIEEGYEIVRKRCDLIFTNSQALKELLGSDREDVFWIPNGVNPDYFKLDDGIKVPEDLEKIPSPRIGYAGKLAKRIDVTLVSYLATLMPESNFIFIGPILRRNWIKPLFRFKNIHFLGDIHYSKLPIYLSKFDVAIIPHNVGPLENQGDPIKLYEYLSAGKPVVTTNIAGVDIYKDLIIIAKSKEEFLRGIQIYLSKSNSERQKIGMLLKNRIPKSCTWEYKANQIIQLIEERLEIRK